MNIDFLDKKEQIALYLEDMYSRFGYSKYRMNKFEQYSFYMENEKFLDDNNVITFGAPNGKLLALKPDITMSIVKNCCKSTLDNHKVYYNESVFRIPKGDSDFKEIQQIGVEYIGQIDTYQTLEVLNLVAKSLAKFSDNYMLCLSNMALILSIFDDLGLSITQRNTIIAYMKQKNIHDLQKYIKDEKIIEASVLIKLLTVSRNVQKGLGELGEIFAHSKYEKQVEQMSEIFEHLDSFIDSTKVQLDFSYITGTEYYNGLIFVGYLDGLAVPALTGGRYDKLVAKMGMTDKSALGFAVNLSAVDKLLHNNDIKLKSVKYNEETDAGELIKKANELYAKGESFCITK